MPTAETTALTWAEQDEGFWFLLNAEHEMVGEVYPRGEGYRWHCKRSDWRQWEASLDEAKTNLLARALKEQP